MTVARGQGLSQAHGRARRIYANASHRSAYVKGAAAAIAGRSRKSNPYHAEAGFGRGFRVAWYRGYDSIAGDDE